MLELSSYNPEARVKIIKRLKTSNEMLELLWYMMDRTASREHTIMTVRDREMVNFMRLASRTDDSVMFQRWDNWTNFFCHKRYYSGIV